MSEKKSENSPPFRRFSDEFKQDAVRLVTQEKYTFAEAATGLPSRSAQSRAVASKRRTSLALLDTNASANQTRWSVCSRTT